jgi:hypothetical protein
LPPGRRRRHRCRCDDRGRRWRFAIPTHRARELRLHPVDGGREPARASSVAGLTIAAENGSSHPVPELAGIEGPDRNRPRLCVEDLGRDLDPMAAEDLREVRVAAHQPVENRLVAVLGDDQAGRSAHDLVEEHLLVVRERLDDDDVHLRVPRPQ